MFFGLSLRQFIFSAFACGVAVAIAFLLHDYLGTETVSWVCILAAAPFALFGFIRYNGMTMEQFIVAWVRSEILMPNVLKFHARNTWYTALTDKTKHKEDKKHVQTARKDSQKG